MGNLSGLARRNMNASAPQGSVAQPASPPTPRMAGSELNAANPEAPSSGREYRRLGSFRDFR